MLVGAAALVQFFNIKAPVRSPACVSLQRISGGRRTTDGWQIYDSKYEVESTVEAHLVFFLKHEGFDALLLKKILLSLSEKDLASYIKSSPTGPITRRIWFLFEYFSGITLKIPDAGKVSTVKLLDAEKYFCSSGKASPRHRVNNNLLGTTEFCPFVRRTELLNSYVDANLSERAELTLKRATPSLVARAASFLLLADTKASFAIENEKIPANNRERWLKALHQVGKHDLDRDEIIRLHEVLIGDFRFIRRGFRNDNVFLGERTHDNEPLPELIGAKPENIESLISGLIDSNNIMRESAVDAVIQAAATSFGFVYIHPFEDGNGRLHRCLIHHILTANKFSSSGLIFPVSSVMLKWIDDYREVLRTHSSSIMDFIEWLPNVRGNVDVTNDTADLYRYFDCTESAEFLYRCVEETIHNDVPKELQYLKRHDEAMRQIMNTVEMPDRMAEDFIMFMRQNEWKLPKRRRESEFAKLTTAEVVELEQIVSSAFNTEV